MTDFDRSFWKNMHPSLGLHRYYGEANYALPTAVPVLMLHGPMTTHRTWDTLAGALWANGLEDLYAADIDDIRIANPVQTQTTDYLNHIVDWILQQYPPDTQLIMIGHSTGGVLARRFLFKSESAPRVRYLFSLASPHLRTYLTHPIYISPEQDVRSSKPTPANIKRSRAVSPETFVVNFFGNAVGPDFDGTVRGVYLPEAVNMVLPLSHTAFKQHQSVIAEILACLRGERYRVQLYLENLCMRGADEENFVGPFCFEINGMRSPFDGVFQAEAEHYYEFHDLDTPLATLAYPNEQALASLIFRLKDLSRIRSVRRRLFAKLLVSMGGDVSALHEMQDNQGSKIALRVHTQQMPPILSRS